MKNRRLTRLSVAALAAVSFASSSPAPLCSEEPNPFPENRLRDFYADQARRFLGGETPPPPVLPAFPGLDGGGWGHWGQNPEDDNSDHRLNEVDTGGLLMQVTSFPDGVATRGVSVRMGGHTVLFDPGRLTYVAAWEGGLPRWSARRYGITSGVRAEGAFAPDLKRSRWVLPEGTPTRYRGFWRHGERVVFVYEIGGATVYDAPVAGSGGGGPGHALTVVGELPVGAALESALPVVDDDGGDGGAKALASPGPARWAGREVVTAGERGAPIDGGSFAIDTLTVPYRDANPFKTPMRIGGLDLLPDGRVAVSTIMGDVWLVSGVDADLDRLVWRRFASGLHQPMGLVVREGQIYVIGRDQLTRLEDRDGDGEADFYVCVTNTFPSTRGNSFALTLHQDAAGRFYWFTRGKQFGMTRYAPGGVPEAIATGLRGVNGTAVSPRGDIVFALPQEGSWQPASAVFEVGGGSYHGFFGPRDAYGAHGYQMPLCFIPRGVDNSSGDAVFLPHDPRLGPLAGRIVGTSFGYCQHYLILREEVGGGVQGGVVPLPGEFLSGAHRLRFNPRDGHLYVAGTDGWQSYARENGSLQRLRYTGGGTPLHLPVAVETRENGLLVRYGTRIDPASVRRGRVFCQQWNYLYSAAYGSAEYSVVHPGTPGHDRVEVAGLHLVEDGRAVFVEIPQLHPVMQLHLYLELAAVGGAPVTTDLYYSIFRQGAPFTDFGGYAPVAKSPWKDFPQPGKNPVDPRLLAQEARGKIVGERGQLAAIARRRVAAVAGLQFEPRGLEVPAGARVALTVENEDPSLPHNWVLVRPGSLWAVGEGSMKLAATREGAARHYVIEDDGVIALSPILQPGTSYTVYFDAPKAPGEYPYLCTYPGHWQVTRGVLRVVE